jgi:hypothetical protein
MFYILVNKEEKKRRNPLIELDNQKKARESDRFKPENDIEEL